MDPRIYRRHRPFSHSTPQLISYLSWSGHAKTQIAVCLCRPSLRSGPIRVVAASARQMLVSRHSIRTAIAVVPTLELELELELELGLELELERAKWEDRPPAGQRKQDSV